MKETFAIINNKDQVVNHIVIDKDDDNFEENMAGQLAHWDCVRYVETTENTPLIVIDASPEIWTTHTEEDGFLAPEGYRVDITPVHVTRKKSELPTDSLLLEENAERRPEGWTWPSDVTVIEG